MLASLMNLLLILMKDKNFKIQRLATNILGEIIDHTHSDEIMKYIQDIVRNIHEVKIINGSILKNDGSMNGSDNTTFEHSKLIRKLIKSSKSNLAVVDAMLSILAYNSPDSNKVYFNKNMMNVRVEMLDIGITSLVEFPLDNEKSRIFSNSKEIHMNNVFNHLLITISQNSNGLDSVGSDHISKNNKLYDMCIEAVALLYCQLGKDKVLALLDNSNTTINSSTYNTIMRRLEEEEIHMKYSKHSKENNVLAGRNPNNRTSTFMVDITSVYNDASNQKNGVYNSK